MSADGGAVGELQEPLRAQIEEKMGEKEANFRLSPLGDTGAVFVAKKLRRNTVVVVLQLNMCGICAVGARALGKSLAEDNVTLIWLNLWSNPKLGDDGAESMAQMLPKNTTLELMFLNNCGIGDQGARALGGALKENTVLKSLHLNNNSGIVDVGADALANALRWNESLENLNLMCCELTDIGALSLLSALRESNSTLTHLGLYGNDIKDHAINESIEELLAENAAVVPTAAECRARCLLFCCLELAPTAHEHLVPSIGAVPVPVMQYAVEHAGKLHVAKRFEVGDILVRDSSAGVRDRSLQPAAARRR